MHPFLEDRKVAPNLVDIKIRRENCGAALSGGFANAGVRK
jgi:hypothetical protein